MIKKNELMKTSEDTESVESDESQKSSNSEKSRRKEAYQRMKPNVLTGDEKFLLRHGHEPQGFSWKPKSESKSEIVTDVRDYSETKDYVLKKKVTKSDENDSSVSFVKTPRELGYETDNSDNLEITHEDPEPETLTSQATNETDNDELQVNEA